MLKTLNFEHLWKCVPKMYPWAPPLFRFLNTPLLTAQRKRYGYFSTWCINPVNLTMLINIVEWILDTHFSGCLHYRCRTKFDVVPTRCHKTSHRLHRPQNMSVCMDQCTMEGVSESRRCVWVPGASDWAVSSLCLSAQWPTMQGN